MRMSSTFHLCLRMSCYDFATSIHHPRTLYLHDTSFNVINREFPIPPMAGDARNSSNMSKKRISLSLLISLAVIKMQVANQPVKNSRTCPGSSFSWIRSTISTAWSMVDALEPLLFFAWYRSTSYLQHWCVTERIAYGVLHNIPIKSKLLDIRGNK